MHAKTAIQGTVSKEGSPEDAYIPQQKHGCFRQEYLQPTRAMDGERGGPEGEALLRSPLYCGFSVYACTGRDIEGDVSDIWSCLCQAVAFLL